MNETQKEKAPYPPYIQKQGHGRKLDAFRCRVILASGKQCPKVEFTRNKMMLHLAVEHGIRKIEQ